MGKFHHSGRDVYYRRAKELGFRARSAFKLLQVDEQCSIFTGATRAVDLCAAPGSWSQVLSRRLGANHANHGDALDNTLDNTGNTEAKVVAVDLQEMAPITGVHILRGDITKAKTAEGIISHFEGLKAHLVVSDGAPDVSGLHEIDEYVQAQLLLAALNITTMVLEEGGSFVAKIFKGECFPLLRSQLEIFFKSVRCIKPESSRSRSAEHFIVCKHYHRPEGYLPKLTSVLPGTDTLGKDTTSVSDLSGVNAMLLPYLGCGDLSPHDEQAVKHEAKALTAPSSPQPAAFPQPQPATPQPKARPTAQPSATASQSPINAMFAAMTNKLNTATPPGEVASLKNTMASSAKPEPEPSPNESAARTAKSASNPYLRFLAE